MWCELTSKQIRNLVAHQLDEKWGFQTIWGVEPKLEITSVEAALHRLERCFEKVNSPYFRVNDNVSFKIEHSVQYAIFLYILSNELYKSGETKTASYVYYLNKSMNSVEWFYAIELPEHFCAEHPLGTVLGRAVYGDYFFVYQGVTVGGNQKGDKIYYPTIGHHVTMFSDSKILGNSHIGNNVIVAANTYIKDMVIPDNSIVFGQYPDVAIRRKMKDKINQVTKRIWLSNYETIKGFSNSLPDV